MNERDATPTSGRRRPLRTRRAVVIAATAVALSLAGPSSAVAAATPVWPAPSTVALPTGAASGANQTDAGLDAVTCTSSGNCTAAGGYSLAKDQAQPMVATETSGVWGPGAAVTVPSNGTPSPINGFRSVACTSPGDCVAVGSYEVNTTPSGIEGLIATETGRVWSPGVSVPIAQLPTGAANTNQDVILQAVTCTSAGNCVVVGQYRDSKAAIQAMTIAETNGTWGQAQEVQLPNDQITTAGKQSAYLASLACTSVGNCVAGGVYQDKNSGGQAMVVTETGGVWGQASTVALPSGQTTTTGAQSAVIEGLACTGEGNCVGVGFYTDTSGNQDAMVVTETGGTWAPATNVALPSGAATAANTQFATLDGVSCPAAGACVADGFYIDMNGSSDYQAMTAVEVGGSWAPATELPLPQDQVTAAGGQHGFISGPDCTTIAVCTAVGSYTPTKAASAAIVVTSVASLSVTSASLPAAQVGSPYDAQVSASGGAGTYTWSISSGSLPAGLQLNSATGTISGTPTTAETAGFTVHASDPGPPVQTATAPLSILVNRAAIPNTVLVKSSVNARKHTAKFTFKATGDATGLQCALVRAAPKSKHGKRAKKAKPHYSACRSPKSYKHLKAGSYAFYVRATGPGGTDNTPASHKFRIR